MNLSESAQNLKARIPEQSAKLCENCLVFFDVTDTRNGKCPFCESDATEFYSNYIKRLTKAERELKEAIRELSASVKEQAA